MNRCELCLLVADYLKSTIVEDPDAEKKIDELATKTCALIPKSYRQEVRRYYMINWFQFSNFFALAFN